MYAVLAEHAAAGEGEFVGDAGEFIGGHLLFEHLLAARVVDLHGERLAREVGGVGLVVLGVPDPELELHLLIGPVDRAIGDEEGLGLVVFGVVDLAVIPGVGEAEVGEAVGAVLAGLGLAGRDQPAPALRHLVLADDDLAVVVRRLVERN